MEKELRNYVSRNPEWMAFWAFLILQCHNHKDIPYEDLRKTLLNGEVNTSPSYCHVSRYCRCSCVPSSCQDGLFWHWVPVNEDLSRIGASFDNPEEGTYCTKCDRCPLYEQGVCRGEVPPPKDLSQSDLASWLIWDILAKLCTETRRKPDWIELGYRGTTRWCTYEIPEPYCDRIDPLSLTSEVVYRFESISRYARLKAPVVGDPAESRGRKVIPITLTAQLTEEGFNTFREVLEFARDVEKIQTRQIAALERVNKSLDSVSGNGCAGMSWRAFWAFVGVLIGLRLIAAFLG